MATIVPTCHGLRVGKKLSDGRPRNAGMFPPGVSGNVGAKPLPERLAARTIQQAFRELADPIDIGNALLSVFSGVDPFDDKKPPADAMPTTTSVPLDWQHRLAAMKMYLEYGYGKPVQGHTIQAQIEATQRITVETSHVAELRELVSANPQIAAMLEQIARATIGTMPPDEQTKLIPTPSSPAAIPVMLPIIDVDADDE